MVADPGHCFVSVDAAQVEARIVAWLAGQQDVVDAFGDGVDLYSEFIGGVIGTEVHKPLPSDSIEDAIRLTALRNIGKDAILGLGFGMGKVKFLRQLKEHPQAEEIRKVLGDRLCLDFTGKMVNIYREKYWKIPVLWKSLEYQFHEIRNGSSSWTEWPNRSLVFRSFKPTFKAKLSVGMQLPSTRVIHYTDLKSKWVTEPFRHLEWTYGANRKIYGGMLTENAVQAIARDILAEAIYLLEKLGYPVILTIHDSVICHVPVEKRDQCLSDGVRILSETPNWGDGLRLGAEGHISKDFN